MTKVWILVGLVGAVAVLLFLVFVIESEIHAKIEEIKNRHIAKEFDKAILGAIKNIKTINTDLTQIADEENDENE